MQAIADMLPSTCATALPRIAANHKGCPKSPGKAPDRVSNHCYGYTGDIMGVSDALDALTCV
jgi:hypothetical protein